jgi:hypothetical protein
MRKTWFAAVLSMLCLAAPFARAELLVGNAYPNQATSGVIGVFPTTLSATLRRCVRSFRARPIPSIPRISSSSNLARMPFTSPTSGEGHPRLRRARQRRCSAFAHDESALLGQPRAVRIDRAHEEMVVIAGNCCIYTWPRLADGSGVNTIRRIPWGGNNVSASGLNNPVGLALNRQRGEIVVGDYKDDAGAGYPNRIFVFSRLTDGLGAAPLRVIEGPNTQLGGRSNVRVAVDEETQTIFALVGRPTATSLNPRACLPSPPTPAATRRRCASSPARLRRSSWPPANIRTDLVSTRTAGAC